MSTKLIFPALLLIAAVASAIVAVRTRPASAQETPPQNFLQFTTCTFPADEVTGEIDDPVAIAEFWLPRAEVSGLAEPPEQVWIDLSLFNNNFAAGTFIGAGPFELSGETQRFDWFGLIPGRRHYYRLNALTDGVWHELGRGVFDTPDCHNTGEFSCDTSDASASVGFVYHIPETSGATEQWIDLSLFNNGFAAGTFIGAGPFSVTPREFFGDSFEWIDILPATQHFYRINVLHEDGHWGPDVVGAFITPDCAGLPSPAPEPLT